MAHSDDEIFAYAAGGLANIVRTSVLAAFTVAVNVAFGAIPGTGSFVRSLKAMPSLKSITKLAIATISAAVYNAADSVMPWIKHVGTFLPDTFNGTWVRDHMFKPDHCPGRAPGEDHRQHV
jgi:hypothetical protein